MSYTERVARAVYWMWVVFGMLSIPYMLFPIGKDNTDPPSGRSGLKIYTDNLTGCQYLQSGFFGGMAPRFDRDGKQICAS